jgi:hypothetical protein
MLGQRSLNLELILLHPEIERTFRRNRKTLVEGEKIEMKDNAAINANQLENVEQPRGENEQARAWNVDYITSLRDLFPPIATNFLLCIVLPPTNAIHFDLKPHVI